MTTVPTNSATLWTVRARFNGTTRQLHQVDPQSTVAALKTRLASNFPGLPADGHTILSGFPPLPLALHDLDEACVSLSDAGIKNCCTLVLHLRSADGAQASAPSTPSPLSSPSRRRQQQQRRKRAKQVQQRASPVVAAAVSAVENGDRDSAAAAATDWRDHLGGRLVAAATAASTPVNSTTTTTNTTNTTNTNTSTNISTTTQGSSSSASSSSSSASSSSTQQLSASLREFRRSFASELKVRQAERLAHQRYEAALSGNVHIEPVVSTAFLAGGGAMAPFFRYTFRVGQRKEISEEHLALPKQLLAALVTQIASNPDLRERMRPLESALYSPRVFWNIVRFYSGPGFEAGLRDLAPTVNWSYLDTRVRNLSEKALLSRQQKAEESAERERAAEARAERKRKRDSGAVSPATPPATPATQQKQENLQENLQEQAEEDTTTEATTPKKKDGD